jgi:NTP pyrophosphatase (non-canonical NTP hydrolase)
MNVLQRLAKECQDDAERWFDLKGREHLPHHVLALCGEAGELANIVKKIERGSVRYEEVADKMRGEVVDNFVYLLNIAAILELDLLEGYEEKRQYNDKRFSKLGLGKASK